MQFSPDGSRLAVCTSTARDRIPVTHIYDVELGTLLGRLTTRAAVDVTSLDWSPDGDRLALAHRRPLCCPGTAVTVWAPAISMLIHRFVHLADATSVVFCPNGRTLASCSDDRTCRLWDAATGLLRPSMPLVHVAWDPTSLVFGFGCAVRAAAFSPDGARVATGCVDGSVWVWDARSGELLARTVGCGILPAFPGVRTLLFSPCGSRVVLEMWVAVVDGAQGESGEAKRTWSLVRETRTVARVGAHGVVVPVPPSDGERNVEHLKISQGAWCVDRKLQLSQAVLSQDGKKLAVGSIEGSVSIY